MDGKVRMRECEVENCYDLPKHINGSKWAKKCLFHYEGEGNE
jgi:hypothetical protein